MWEPCWLPNSARPLAGASRFRPPSLPGIGTSSAVSCFRRQAVREPQGNRSTQTADSLTGLPGSTPLAAAEATQPRPLDGAVPAARRSPAQLPVGSPEELVLL